MGFILASSVAKSIGANMIDARNETLQATPIETRAITLEDHQQILDTLGQIEPPTEASRALAKYAVQRSLRLPFMVDQHVALASEETPGRSWGKRVLQLHTRKFGNGGFRIADLENEAIMLDLDEVIWPPAPTLKDIMDEWDADIAAEKERILEARNVNTR